MHYEDGPMIAHMDELWHKLLEVTRHRDQLLAAIALHKLVVSQASDDGDVLHDHLRRATSVDQLTHQHLCLYVDQAVGS